MSVIELFQSAFDETARADLADHVADTANPHAVTKSQVGLTNADNTSDAAKPVSILQLAAIAAVQVDADAAIAALATHEADTVNPHSVTKTQVGLGNVDNTSDAAKPVSTAQLAAIDAVQGDVDTAIADLAAHGGDTTNPHLVTKTQVGLGNVDNTADANKPISTAAAAALAAKAPLASPALTDTPTAPTAAPGTVTTQLATTAFAQAAANVASAAAADAQDDIDAHVGNTTNPHSVTKTQVGLGNVDNTADAAKPVSSAAQTALNAAAAATDAVVADLATHEADTVNPHAVTKTQVGLGNADNTSDAAKPVSTATQTAINVVQASSDAVASDLADHEADIANPHAVTKIQAGLPNVDNTSDANKPVSTATQTALNLKANIASPTFTGTPAGPTAAPGTDTTQLATTAFVQGVADTAQGAVDVVAADLAAHAANVSNPHSVTKSQAGLANVDNTSDANKPVSTATATALTLKAPLASPALTDTPTAPTAVAGTSSTQIATTAYAKAGDLAGQVGERPGDAVHLYGTSQTGTADDATAVDVGWVINGASGRVVRVNSATAADPQTVSSAAAFPIEAGRVYQVRWKVQRQTDPVDPLNDTVRLGIRWLQFDKTGVAGVGGTTTVANLDIVAADGVMERTAFVALASGAGVTHVAPAGTVYARPFVEMFGDSHVTDVIVIELQPGAYDVQARADITALQAVANFGTTLEAIAATIGAEVTFLRTGGYSAQGDGGGGEFVRGALNGGGITTAGAITWTNVTPRYNPMMFAGGPSTIDVDGSNAAAINAGIAAAAADGKVFHFPLHEEGYSLGAPMLLVDGFNIVCDPGTVLWRDFGGPGRELATIIQDDIATAITGFGQDIAVKSRDADAYGISWAINLTGSTLVRPSVLQYFRTEAFGAIAMIIGLTDSVVEQPVIEGSPDETGTSAFRPFIFVNSVVRDGRSDSGDDGWQFVPQASPGTDIFNGDFRDSWYIDCHANSTKGRIGILQIDETISKSITNCGWVRTSGKCGNRGLVIESKSGFKYSAKIDRDGLTAGTIGLQTLSRRGFRPFQTGEVLTVTGSSDASFNKDIVVDATKDATTGRLSFTFSSAGTITWAGGDFTALFAEGDYVVAWDAINSILLNHGAVFKITGLTAEVLTVDPVPQTETVTIEINANPTLYFVDTDPAGSSTGSPMITRKNPARFDAIDVNMYIDQSNDVLAGRQTLYLRGPGSIRNLDVVVANCKNVMALIDRGIEGYGAAHPWRIKMLDRPRDPDNPTFLIRDCSNIDLNVDLRGAAGFEPIYFGETPSEEDEEQLEAVYASDVTVKGRIADIDGGQWAANVTDGTRINFHDVRPVEAADAATRAKGFRYDVATGIIVRPDFSGLPTTSYNEQVAFTASSVVKVYEPQGLVTAGTGSTLAGTETLTGSPFTCRKLPYRAHWRVLGGTVSSITVNGLVVAATTDADFDVPPQSTVIITYSVVPTTVRYTAMV